MTSPSVNTRLLAQRVKEARVKQGMSVREYAAFLGIPSSSVARIENLHGSPSAGTLCLLMYALNLTPHQLLVFPHQGDSHHAG